MDAKEPLPAEQQFESWLINYHEALATPAAEELSPVGEPTSEMPVRMQRVQACLQLLERVLPRIPNAVPDNPLGNSSEKDPLESGSPVRIDRFEIRRELGRGGFGIVFLAWDPKLGREVALKMPRGNALLDVELRRRFIWEAQTTAGLCHPNIVPVHEAGLAGAVLYITSEYCPGTTLADWLARRRRPVSARSAATLVATLADTVHYIHSQGILHRDLKSRNILLTLPPNHAGPISECQNAELEDFFPKVTDFGLAKVLERAGDETKTGTAIGTVRYMAPEQVRGRSKEISWYADVYALGVILYELLAGHPPFRDDGQQDTREQILSDTPAPPLPRSAGVPRDLGTICHKCLHKEPQKRYASAQALAEDLRRYLRGEAIHARPTGLCERTWKAVRRRPATALATVIASACLFASCLVIGGNMVQRSITESVAEANHYHALVHGVAERIVSAPLGGKQASLRDLREAHQLPTDARDLMRLRNLAVRCLAAIDFKPVGVLAQGHTPFCLAFRPDGKQLAVAPELDAAGTSILIFDTASRQLQLELPLPTASPATTRTPYRVLTYSADQRWLAAGGRKGELLVWDLSQPIPIRHLWQAHDGTVTGLTFSPDGQFLFSSGEDKFLKAWPRGDWSRAVACARFDHPLEEITLSPDGSVLACGWPDGITLVETHSVVTGACQVNLLAYLKGPHYRVAYHPGGRILAVSQRYGICLLHYENKELAVVRRLPAEEGQAHDAEINHLSFSPDGALLASGAGDRKIKVWEIASGRLLATIPVTGEGNVFPVFSPTGRHLAITSEQGVLLLELNGLEEQTFLAPSPRPIRALAFGGTDGHLACLADYLPNGESWTGQATIWQRAAVAPQHSYSVFGVLAFIHGRAPALAYHPQERALTFAGDQAHNLHAWRFTLHEHPIHRRAFQITALSFSPDGKRLWGVVDNPDGPDQLICWSWPDLSILSRWGNITSKAVRMRTGLLSLCAGRRWILAGSADTYTKLLAATEGSQLVREWPSPDRYAVHSVALNPEETLAASGSQVGTVTVVRLDSPERFMELSAHDATRAHRDSVDALAFSPDGTLLASGSKDGTVRLWRGSAGTFEEIVTLPAAGPVRQLAFTPDGQGLAVLVQNERAVRLWHLERLNQSLKELDLDW